MSNKFQEDISTYFLKLSRSADKTIAWLSLLHLTEAMNANFHVQVSDLTSPLSLEWKTVREIELYEYFNLTYELTIKFHFMYKSFD